jgi:hypothetical protein
MNKVITRVQTEPNGIENKQYFIWSGDGGLTFNLDASWRTMADVARQASQKFGAAEYEISRNDDRAKIEIYTWS